MPLPSESRRQSTPAPVCAHGSRAARLCGNAPVQILHDNAAHQQQVTFDDLLAGLGHAGILLSMLHRR